MRLYARLPDDETLVTSPQLRERLGGASHMQPARLLERDPNFPRPLYIGNRRYWRLGELRQWEAQLPRQTPPALQAAHCQRVATRKANEARRKAIAASGGGFVSG